MQHCLPGPSPPKQNLSRAPVRRSAISEARTGSGFSLAASNGWAIAPQRRSCAVAYDISSDWVRGAVAGKSLWRTPLYGYNAYVDGHPVATAFAVPLEGVLYVAFVATATTHRRRGLAELVMRRCLETATQETGITRTALHATADGYPSYIRMGYRPVDECSLYVPS